ncbi:hypothetical protein [uncultured Roseobacter sp.]|uniref:hypothetical protein n=1 Tax=uncultured Roseobacter sp. TaxID=114847 RepID=UPI00262F9398|nr:hypothetical protein [uncultured Roseobacter sp.]
MDSHSSKNWVQSTSIGQHSNVFLLHTGSNRTSVYTQQCRALAFAEALLASERIEKAGRLAIVGSGVTAVTLAVALGKEFQRTDIFIEENMIFPQRYASHRYIHPTINSWPNERLDATTDLPFLNWFAGAACDVVDQLQHETESLFEKNSIHPHLNTKVVSVTEAEEGELRLQTSENDEAQADRFSCMIIVETGFGYDFSSDAGSYWQPDNIPKMENQRILVSGSGDGALIDALRFNVAGDDVEELSIKLADLLTGSPLADEISANESEYGDQPSDRTMQYEFYLELARKFRSDDAYKVHRTLLDETLTQRNLVILTGDTHGYFFDRDVSPILKLMIAYAVLYNGLRLARRDTQGRLSDARTGETLEFEVDQIVVRAANTERSIQDHLNLEFRPLDPDFLSSEDKVHPKSRWASLSGQTVSRDHAIGLRQLAEKYVHRDYGAILSMTQDGFVAWTKDDDPGGRLPNQIFGVPVRFRSLESVPTTNLLNEETSFRAQTPTHKEGTAGFTERVSEQNLISARVNSAIEEVRDKFDDIEMVEICTKILKRIERAKTPARFRITFGLLKELTLADPENHKLLSALSYMSSSQNDLLKMTMTFKQGHEIQFDVSRPMLAVAEAKGYVEHPLTGARFEQFKSCLFPYFLPGSALTGANR